VNTELIFRRYGAGSVTVAAGAGVTINSPAGLLSITHQYGEVVATKRATNEWILSGDLS
jgi:hypothetical protein